MNNGRSMIALVGMTFPVRSLGFEERGHSLHLDLLLDAANHQGYIDVDHTVDVQDDVGGFRLFEAGLLRNRGVSPYWKVRNVEHCLRR